MTEPTLKKLVILVAGLWIGLAAAQFWMFRDMETRAQFGEMFGPANALFSGLAFAVIYLSLLAQHKDIQEQKIQFRQQAELTALTAYTDITRALWENNMRRFEQEPNEFWDNAVKGRYAEMIKAKESFEKVLKERGLI
jgi:hypothetical protein